MYNYLRNLKFETGDLLCKLCKLSQHPGPQPLIDLTSVVKLYIDYYTTSFIFIRI